MKYWIFQAKPDRLDMARDARFRSGSRAKWQATRYRTEMNPGDIVYFWQSGERESRGIYGWGRIRSKPYSDGESHYVDIEYVHKLSHHIRSSTIEERKDLANLMILRLAVGTNFLINRTEGEAIARLMPEHMRPEVHDV